VMVVAFEAPVPLWAFPATLALYLWIHVARAVRGAFMSLRGREFIEALTQPEPRAARSSFGTCSPTRPGRCPSRRRRWSGNRP